MFYGLPPVLVDGWDDIAEQECFVVSRIEREGVIECWGIEFAPPPLNLFENWWFQS